MTPSVSQDITAALASAGLLIDSPQTAAPPVPAAPGPKPNILFVLVDEMRFPSVFPAGIKTAGDFLKTYMPRVHSLWQKGVKFENYHTAACACTPARGTLLTGLYSQQTWLCCTLTGAPQATTSVTPLLNDAFPTFGKLLREAGYHTPYIGKWHVSLKTSNEPGCGLEKYGFEGFVWPDTPGFNLQGTVGNHPYYPNDQEVSRTAVAWLKENSHSPEPWCLTVSYVNPHDKEFFWAGTEFKTYNDLFTNVATNPSGYAPINYYGETETGGGAPPVPWVLDVLKDPPACGYSLLPPNWESAAQLAATKPSTHTLARTGQAAIWGGCTDDPQQTAFTIQPFPADRKTELAGINYGVGTSPFSYWARGLDCYTEAMRIVDERIGEVLEALPADVAENTVIIFASDHGEYAGAHGLLSGKMLTCYKEAFHVPLVVVDPSGRFAADTHRPRRGLVSSVDMLRFLVSLGHNGSQEWLTTNSQYQELYGGRHDLLPMLKSADAPGRNYALLATDEVVPGWLNFNQAPTHILGVVTDLGKFATYSHWWPSTDTVRRISMETELYDYTTAAGRAETQNLSRSLVNTLAANVLLDQLLPNELRAPLPEELRAAQLKAKEWYLAYEKLNAVLPPKAPSVPDLDSPFGQSF